MKRQQKPTEEQIKREEREKWAEIPKRPQRAPEAEDHFNAAHILARDEGVDADALAHSASRRETWYALRRAEFSDNEQAVVLACGDTLSGARPTVADIARKTQLHRHTVENILTRPKVRRCLQNLRRGTLPAPNTQPAPTETGTLPGLLAELRDNLANERAAAWHYCGIIKPAGDWGAAHKFQRVWKIRDEIADLTGIEQKENFTGCPLNLFWQTIVKCVRTDPATLTNGTGMDWPAKLAEIITAANYGNKAMRREARKALALFTHSRRRGTAIGYDKHGAWDCFYRLCGQLGKLRREYQKTFGDKIPARLAALRAKHPGELNGDFADDKKLQKVLNGKPRAVAIELAASVSGTSADYWHDLVNAVESVKHPRNP